MTPQLFYFSGTGNSLDLARDLARNLDDTELVSISTVSTETIDINADTVGFVFPVYAWGVPRIMAEFIKKLKFSGNEYVFAVVTCGGQPAGTLPQLAELLKAKGVTLKAGFAVIQPTNYILWNEALPEEKQAAMFAAKAERLPGILDVIRAQKSMPLEQGSAVTNFVLGQIYKLSVKGFPTSDKSFWVTEQCNNCGQCMRLCPRANISLAGGRMHWHGDCEMCLSCIQWCPREAIQYKKKTIGRKRYHHPGVKIADFWKRD